MSLTSRITTLYLLDTLQETYFNNYRSLQDTHGFQFTERSRDTLPPGYPTDVDGGTCYFLDGYIHPIAGQTKANIDQIRLAVSQLNISPNPD